MGKRFTDTDKWKKNIIKKMPPAYKLLWLYLCDDCDNAGVWHVDFDVAQLRVGEPLDEERAKEYFDGKIVIIDGGLKWFIPSFIEFQYGELRPNNKAHVSVIQKIEKLNLSQYLNVGFKTPLNNNIKGEKRDAVFERDNYTCAYCDIKYDSSNLQPDHITPLDGGGTNELNNVVTSCKDCNRKKSNKKLEVFIKEFNLNHELIYLKINTVRGLYAPLLGAKEKDKDKEMDMEMVKDMDKAFGKFENLLTELEIGSTIEFVSITANKNLKAKEVEDYWTAFGIHSEQKYPSRAEKLKHFRSWLKIQIQTKKDGNTAIERSNRHKGAGILIAGLKQDFAARRKEDD